MPPALPELKNSPGRTATAFAKAYTASFTPLRTAICVSWWSRFAIVGKSIGRPSNEALQATRPNHGDPPRRDVPSLRAFVR